MHHYTFKYLPQSFQNTWCTVAETREDPDHPTLRNEEDYHIPFVRLSSCDTRPLVYFPRLWNKFVNPIKSIPNKNTLKKELNVYFMDKLSDNYQCDRLLCHHCHL